MDENNDKIVSLEKDLYPERANFWNELSAHYPADDENLIEPNNKPNVKGEL